MASRAAPSTSPAAPAADNLPDYPDSLDGSLLRIAGVCILASVMAIVDATVVGVAQRTFIPSSDQLKYRGVDDNGLHARTSECHPAGRLGI